MPVLTRMLWFLCAECDDPATARAHEQRFRRGIRWDTSSSEHISAGPMMCTGAKAAHSRPSRLVRGFWYARICSPALRLGLALLSYATVVPDHTRGS